MSPTTKDSDLRVHLRKHYDRCVQAANQITSVGASKYALSRVKLTSPTSLCVREAPLSKARCGVLVLLRVHGRDHARLDP